MDHFFAKPGRWSHAQSECASCGKPVYTNYIRSERTEQADPWRHADTAAQECYAVNDSQNLLNHVRVLAESEQSFTEPELTLDEIRGLFKAADRQEEL